MSRTIGDSQQLLNLKEEQLSYVERADLDEINEEILKRLSKLVKLEHLIIRDDNLTTFPIEITELVQLKDLEIIGTKMILLPKEIGKLINLRSLNLRKNQIIAIPVEIKYLTTLEVLDLTENPLDEMLPAEMDELKLKYLYTGHSRMVKGVKIKETFCIKPNGNKFVDTVNWDGYY